MQRSNQPKFRADFFYIGKFFTETLTKKLATVVTEEQKLEFYIELKTYHLRFLQNVGFLEQRQHELILQWKHHLQLSSFQLKKKDGKSRPVVPGNRGWKINKDHSWNLKLTNNQGSDAEIISNDFFIESRSTKKCFRLTSLWKKWHLQLRVKRVQNFI